MSCVTMVGPLNDVVHHMPQSSDSDIVRYYYRRRKALTRHLGTLLDSTEAILRLCLLFLVTKQGMPRGTTPV